MALVSPSRRISIMESTSVNSSVKNIIYLIDTVKKNKAHAHKFAELVKQIAKAVNGLEYKFIKQAEFFSDLKETLHKIHIHVEECTHRTKISQFIMAKKDHQMFADFQKHVDMLCGRIILANAQRMEIRRNSK